MLAEEIIERAVEVQGVPVMDGMRLVIARCEVDYAGRLDAHLPLATRLIMVKADGCVAVHESAYIIEKSCRVFVLAR